MDKYIDQCIIPQATRLEGGAGVQALHNFWSWGRQGCLNMINMIFYFHVEPASSSHCFWISACGACFEFQGSCDGRRHQSLLLPAEARVCDAYALTIWLRLRVGDKTEQPLPKKILSIHELGGHPVQQFNHSTDNNVAGGGGQMSEKSYHLSFIILPSSKFF